MKDTITLPRSIIEDTIHALERYAVKRQDFERFESELAMLKAALDVPATEPQPSVLSKAQAKQIRDMALDLEKTGRLVSLTEGQERSDFVARNRGIQCALEDYLRNLTEPVDAPKVEAEHGIKDGS